MKHLSHWLIDYVYLLRGHSYAILHRKAPEHYLGHIVESKNPIIFIPGFLEDWRVFAKIANEISLLGHPVYIVPRLGHTIRDIPSAAAVVCKLIEENNLSNVTIIAHSKGGLIGKFLLAHLNTDKRVKRLIAIATPFSGTTPAKYIPMRHFKELSSSSKVVADLNSHAEVNDQIVSIYPAFDNHVWPQSSAYLEGSKNISLDVHGHHKILFDTHLRNTLMKLI